MSKKKMKPDKKEKKYRECNVKSILFGYGWQRIKIVCINCLWKGRRIWSPNMFKKPCPECKTVTLKGETTVWSPNYVVVNGRRMFCQ